MWSDTALRVALWSLLLLAATLVLGPMIYVRTPFNQGRQYPVDQPVQFDHRHHVRDEGIDCRYCHSEVDRSAYAGVPATEVCMGCHNQVWPGSAILEGVRRSYFTGLPMPWNRVHRLPDYVYFNHAIHIHKGVECVTCHGQVDQMALNFQVSSLTMGWCLGCHRDTAKYPRAQVSTAVLTDCYTCHR